MIAIISRDGGRIGLCETEPQGVGTIAWFHKNAGGQSMSHYLAHEGYSVEEVEEVDCHEVEALLSAICARIGVTMEAAFVPFSQSRNAKEKDEIGNPRYSLNWRVTLKRRDRAILETDYMQGMGHAPCAKIKLPTMGRHAALRTRLALEKEEAETGRPQSYSENFGRIMPRGGRIDPPSVGAVISALALDSGVLDAGGFEEWAGYFGYDPDSRSAESTYRACMEIAMKLRAALGEPVLAELRLAASFN